MPDGLPRQLGDVVVCPHVCALEAASAEPTPPGGRPRSPLASVGEEWRKPLVHALLHLVGYDHGAEMEAKEELYA